METDAAASGPFASLHLQWGWLLALGIALIILGTVALGDTLAVTLISVFLVGWLLVASGAFHVIHLVRQTEVRSFWNLLGTICDFLAGFYLVAQPALGALTLTLVLAAFLLASGVTRMVGVFHVGLPHKFWPVLNCVLSIVLGILLWVHWPWTGLWFIGFAIAIELIFHGWAWVMVALALRSGAAGSPKLQPSA
ncbi:MAG TPA: HdeD family acid-resistance protein [Candidatus Binataceae bacterium]|nr:HdeD family acid-resistance protein [Candidatus Binataceae bacterium]